MSIFRLVLFMIVLSIAPFSTSVAKPNDLVEADLEMSFGVHQYPHYDWMYLNPYRYWLMELFRILEGRFPFQKEIPKIPGTLDGEKTDLSESQLQKLGIDFFPGVVAGLYWKKSRVKMRIRVSSVELLKFNLWKSSRKKRFEDLEKLFPDGFRVYFSKELDAALLHVNGDLYTRKAGQDFYFISSPLSEDQEPHLCRERLPDSMKAGAWFVRIPPKALWFAVESINQADEKPADNRCDDFVGFAMSLLRGIKTGSNSNSAR